MGIIKAICISEKRGTEKKTISEAVLVENYGIERDAHAGNWHRQVSLLSYDKVEEFNRKGGGVASGDFGENLLVEGFDFRSMPVGTRLITGDTILEITQIGKECHSHCTIYKRVGECIMPKEGVFARVIKGGVIHTGDEMRMELPRKDRSFQVAVITLSDKGFRGERKDESGAFIEQYMKERGYEIVERILLPDEQIQIQKNLIRLSDSRQVDLIFTTGGTGFAMRDCTPEATLAVADRIAPGIAEAIRYGSMQITKRAMLGRGVSVIRKHTLIINLPGSPKAVKESLDFVIEQLPHGIELLRGTTGECGKTISIEADTKSNELV